MFYIFNKDGKNIASCDSEPNIEDLETRGEYCKQAEGEQAIEIKNALSRGFTLLSDFSLVPPAPSIFHEWNGKEWIDPRTEDEIRQHNRALLPLLTKRQLNRVLLTIPSDTHEDKQAELEDYLSNNRLARVDYESITDIYRLDEMTIQIAEALGFSADRLDELWAEAAKL